MSLRCLIFYILHWMITFGMQNPFLERQQNKTKQQQKVQAGIEWSNLLKKILASEQKAITQRFPGHTTGIFNRSTSSVFQKPLLLKTTTTKKHDNKKPTTVHKHRLRTRPQVPPGLYRHFCCSTSIQRFAKATARTCREPSYTPLLCQRYGLPSSS